MSASESGSASASASAASVAGIGLTPAQLAQFDRDGYLVLADFFPSATADRLKAHADELLQQFDLATHPRAIFKTNVEGEQTRTSASDKNRYFLDSADKVHFFFEEHAFNDKGELIVTKEKAINKIGHQLHTLDDEFHTFTYSDNVKAVARSLGFKEPTVLQSMVICKQPRIGGVVDPHRDSTFLYTKPSTATGMWFAFEDCTQSNGCLSFVPGSHKDGASTKRFVRHSTSQTPLRPTVNNVEYDATTMPVDQTPNNENVELIFTGADTKTYRPEEFIPVEVKKGAMVLINGEVVHASTHNHSEKSRYIYTFHLIDQHGTTYPQENWLQSSKPFAKLNH